MAIDASAAQDAAAVTVCRSHPAAGGGERARDATAAVKPVELSQDHSPSLSSSASSSPSSSSRRRRPSRPSRDERSPCHRRVVSPGSRSPPPPRPSPGPGRRRVAPPRRLRPRHLHLLAHPTGRLTILQAYERLHVSGCVSFVVCLFVVSRRLGAPPPPQPRVRDAVSGTQRSPRMLPAAVSVAAQQSMEEVREPLRRVRRRMFPAIARRVAGEIRRRPGRRRTRRRTPRRRRRRRRLVGSSRWSLLDAGVRRRRRCR